MANRYKIIGEKTCERAMHCMIFRNSVESAFCVTFEADITHFLKKIKKQGYSFTIAFVYAVCRCTNDIDVFQYRFLDGKVVLFDKIDTAFTYLNKETELFKVINVPMKETLEKYVELAARIAQEQKEYFTGPLGNVYFGVLRCFGLLIRTYHIPILDKRIMRLLYLIGENTMRKMDGL